MNSSLFQNDLIWLIPEIFLVYSILVLLMVGVFYNKKILSLGVSVLEVLVKLSLLVLWLTAWLYWNQYGWEVFLLSEQITKNNLILLLILVVVMSTMGYLLMVLNYIRKDTLYEFEYLILILLATCGMITVLTANDLIVVYLGIELQSLSLYILATFKQESNYSTEAGLKYFIMGALSSCIFLFGLSLLYGFTGLLNLQDLHYFLMTWTLTEEKAFGLIVSIMCIFCSLLFKVGAVPFYMWLPDVYEGAPTIVTSYFAIIPKVVIFSFFFKFYLLILNSLSSEWSIMLVYCGLSSILLGGLAALYQKTIKRLVAYSAISHTGFILVGLSVNSIEGLNAVYLYLFIYLVLSINVFSILVALRKKTNFELLKLIGNMDLIYNSNRILGLSICLAFFSIAGIPPLAGFFSKLYIFFSLIKEGEYLISLISVLISVIGVVYYLRVIKTMLFGVEKKWGFFERMSKGNAYVITLSSFFGIFFCFFSESIILFLHQIILLSYF